jgi:hypothetical protein
MALNDAALVIGATAMKNAITHLQLHSAASGPNWTTNVVGTRVAASGAVDADGDISWTNVQFTGLTANQAIGGVSYWSASSAGTNYGGVSGAALTGDSTANSAGETTVNVTETSTAS